MKRKIFWNRVSNYALAVMILALIAKMYFKSYLEDVILYILVIGVLAAIVFFIALLMQSRSDKSR